jgi:hypothetical protein
MTVNADIFSNRLHIQQSETKGCAKLGKNQHVKTWDSRGQVATYKDKQTKKHSPRPQHPGQQAQLHVPAQQNNILDYSTKLVVITS